MTTGAPIAQPGAVSDQQASQGVADGRRCRDSRRRAFGITGELRHAGGGNGKGGQQRHLPQLARVAQEFLGVGQKGSENPAGAKNVPITEQ